MMQGSHIRCQDTSFKGRSFISQGKRVRGITTGWLKSNYYPTYNWKEAIQQDIIEPIHIITSENGIIQTPKLIKLPPIKTKFSKILMARGRRVDQKVGQALEWMCKHQIPLSYFDLNAKLSPDLSKFQGITPSIQRKIYTWLKNKTIHARLIFSAVRRLRLTPLATQVIVRDTKYHATACDLICKDNQGSIVIIEFKAINQTKMFNYCKHMKAPYQKFTDSPLNQSFVQLGTTRSFYKKTFPQTKLSTNAYTFTVSDRNCQIFKLPSAFL